MGPTPVYGARAEKPLQKADFAMKQTNICRLIGDIIRFNADVQCRIANRYHHGAENAINRPLLFFTAFSRSCIDY